MAFRETCVVLLLLQHTGSALEISVPSTLQATVGSLVLIPCNYTVQKPPVNPKLFAAFWYLEGKQILSYDDEVRTTDPRYSLDIEKALNGRVDLSISNIALSDAGVYACSVRYSRVRKTKDITLYVTAPPQVTIRGKTVVLNEERVLRCSVTGFYPVDIGIKWFRGREMLRDVTEDEPQRNSDGSYSVNSTATITPTEEDREQNFSCRVQHESLKKPLQEDFQLLYRVYRDENVMPENQSLLIADVIMIIISAAVGILVIIFIVVLYRNTLSELNALSVGSAGEQIMPLMQKLVSAATRPRQDLPWRPHVGSISVPKLEDWIKTTLTCEISGYFPDHLSVSWFIKKDGDVTAQAIEPSKMKRTYRISHKEEKQNDHTYNYEASLSFTPLISADQGSEIICRVEHPSLECPIETSTGPLNIEDCHIQKSTGPFHIVYYIGTLTDLEIGDINVPELILGETATLTCRLYNYILGVHTVEWFEESPERGEQRAVNDPRRLITIDEQSEDERIYRANLTLTPVTGADDGITYICRVKTSNTQKTIEKRTERLHVKRTAEERTTEEWRTEGGERLLRVNESIHEEKQKTSAELETDLLGEHDNQDCTPVLENGKSKGSIDRSVWEGFY